MLLRAQFNHYCEVVGRASACVAFVSAQTSLCADRRFSTLPVSPCIGVYLRSTKSA